MSDCWVPESVRLPGNFAHCDYSELNDSCIYTMELEEALTFENYGDCRQWCDDHPKPQFRPQKYDVFQELPF